MKTTKDQAILENLLTDYDIQREAEGYWRIYGRFTRYYVPGEKSSVPPHIEALYFHRHKKPLLVKIQADGSISAFEAAA